MKNLRHLRGGPGVHKMLASRSEVSARGPARRGPRKFFIPKALRTLRPQREWSLPTLRPGVLVPAASMPLGMTLPQREWSLPTLRQG